MTSMHHVVAAAFAIAFGMSSARATVIDLSAMQCQQFLKSSKDDIGVILTWLNGYYREEDDPPIIDTDKFVADSKQLAEYCVANPTIGLITAADKLFAAKK
jgi:acid stress chaperone HdeB